MRALSAAGLLPTRRRLTPKHVRRQTDPLHRPRTDGRPRFTPLSASLPWAPAFSPVFPHASAAGVQPLIMLFAAAISAPRSVSSPPAVHAAVRVPALSACLFSRSSLARRRPAFRRSMVTCAFKFSLSLLVT